MVSKKLFSAVLATLVILSIIAGSSVAFAQNATTGNVTKNATEKVTANATAKVNKTAVVSAVASKAAGFLGLPGFEALYTIAGLLVVAFLVIRRQK
jgi:PGF-CTERM protein